MCSPIPKAAVVGAGIAGLSAAVALRRAGWEVEVFEKSRMKNEVGAAITILPMGSAILRDWGFDFDRAAGVPCERMTIIHAGNHQVLAHEAFPNLDEQYGGPALFYHRVDLHQGLLELAQRDADQNLSKGIPVKVNLGQQVVDVMCGEGRPTLASGESLEKDLIIVANGAHGMLFSGDDRLPEPPVRMGRSIFRILLNMKDVQNCPEGQRLLNPASCSLTGMCCAMDPATSTLLVTYPCRSGQILNVAVVHNTVQSSDRCPEAQTSWQSPSSVSEVLEVARNFHPDLKAILQLAGEEDVTIHHGMYRPPLNSYTRGKVLGVGDAVCLMLPTHAAEASIAIERAGVLEVLFRDTVTATRRRPIGQSPKVAAATSSSTRHIIQGIEDTPTSQTGTNTGLGKESDEVQSQPRVSKSSTAGETTWSSVISRSLMLFDSLRVPRCTAVQILSNGGIQSQARPDIVEQIRRHGFDGPLPRPTAGPFVEEFRKWFFEHDARAAAERALLKPDAQSVCAV